GQRVPGARLGGARGFVCRGAQLLVERAPREAPSDALRVRARRAWARLPLQKSHDWLGAAALRTLYLGALNGTQCWVAELPKDAEPPPGMSWEGLRTRLRVPDDGHVALSALPLPPG